MKAILALADGKIYEGQHFVSEKEVKIGQIVHALRVAVTGKAVGFGIFETLEILGKPACLQRIDRTLTLVNSQ